MVASASDPAEGIHFLSGGRNWDTNTVTVTDQYYIYRSRYCEQRISWTRVTDNNSFTTLDERSVSLFHINNLAVLTKTHKNGRRILSLAKREGEGEGGGGEGKEGKHKNCTFSLTSVSQKLKLHGLLLGFGVKTVMGDTGTADVSLVLTLSITWFIACQCQYLPDICQPATEDGGGVLSDAFMASGSKQRRELGSTEKHLLVIAHADHYVHLWH